MRPEYHFQIEYDDMPDDESLLVVNGNERLIKTAILNLMDNACKFSKDKTVQVRISSKKDHIEITFIDKGIGIPLEEQEKIFSPFFRASNVPAQNKGYGIGLPLCQRIVLLHNGSLTVESKSGKGSRFRLKLPIRKD